MADEDLRSVLDPGRRGGRPRRSPPGRRADRGRPHRRGRAGHRRAGRRRVLDAGGCIVAPALVDLHAHLREPGREDAETIETGTAGRRARRVHGRGGHAQHRPGHRLGRGGELGPRPGRPVRRRRGDAGGRITIGRAGEQLAPMGELAADPESRVTIFTDDGAGVQDDLLMRRAMEYASACRPVGVDRAGPALRDRPPGRGRLHARGGVVGQARAARHPGRGRGADGGPRHRAGPADRCPPPLPAPVDGEDRSSWCGRPRPTAWRSRPRRPPHHFTLTDAELRRLRPGVQGQPAAAHRRRRRRHPGRSGRRHDRRHRHRPRAAHPGRQGAAARPGAPGHARPRDGAGSGPRRARPAPRARAGADVVAAGGDRRAWGPTHGGRIAGGHLGRTSACSTRTRPGRSTAPSWPARAATRRTRAARCGARCATRSSGPAVVVLDGEAQAMTAPASITEAASGAGRRHDLRGRGDRRAGRGRHRRGRVQHRADRLPGGDHRPVLRRADHHLHLPAHRQLRRDARRRRERPALLPRRDRARPGPPPQQLAQRRRPRRLPAPPRRGRHRRHRHPPPDPPHPRHRRHARRVRHGRRGRR